MAVFALPAVVDLASATALVAQAVNALGADAAPWCVDAAQLERFDSSCLALLLQLRRLAPAQNLRVDAAPARLRQLAEAYGIEFVFD